MPSFEDEEDRDNGSANGSSDNEGDETMRDVDDGEGDIEANGDGDADLDAEGDGDDDGESQSDGSSDDDEGGGDEGPAATQDQPQAGASSEEPSTTLARREAITTSTYDIVPTIAAPQSTSINSICATSDTRWVFTGGSDGYIRKFNWVDSVNSKLMLTVAQRHPFVDSVVKAGVLMTYWENWDAKLKPDTSISSSTQVLSPVYSLACQHQGLWLLSGTASGAIRFQTLRHEEGREIALLHQHTSAVSALSLSSDERSLLSGSWDKSVLEWDLETGKLKTRFASATSQISAIEPRPASSVPVPVETGELQQSSGTFSSNNQQQALTNGVHSRRSSQPPEENKAAPTPDSLFGGDEGDDDLFGDSGGGVMSNGVGLQDGFADEDDPMGQAIADAAQTTGAQDSQEHTLEGPQPLETDAGIVEPELSADGVNGFANTSEQPLPNGLPHAEDAEMTQAEIFSEDPSQTPTSESTFLVTSIDGAIRVWDKRTPTPVARVLPRNTPPWCLSACWSPDGNFIYAGRRNNTVEEYDLRNGLKQPERVFRFPNGSGAVTSVKAMPNGKHLICASYDILRLYDLSTAQGARSTVPFLIVPGHRTGVISHVYIDPACRYMMSAGGNRGWEGTPTDVLLGYEINIPS